MEINFATTQSYQLRDNRITGHNTQPCFHNSLTSEAQENGDQAKIGNTFLVPPQGSFL